ncbi:MAG: HD domain-containing protein [Lachnospiraceae bacterium]|nr:HD domain-containing protein [Lachnospiraceae bacterium]
MIRVMTVLVGVLVNVFMAYVVHVTGLPIYLDTIGTMVVAIVGGIFPGMMTAVLTNTLCTMFSADAIFFTFVNTMIALFTAWFAKRYGFKKVRHVIIYILGAGLISAALSTVIQLLIFGGAQRTEVARAIEVYWEATGISREILLTIITILLNIFDKWVSLVLALIALHIIPERYKVAVQVSGWKQRPLSEEDIESISKWDRDVKHSIRNRITFLLTGISMALVIIMGFTGIDLFYSSAIKTATASAKSATGFAMSIMDKSAMDEYLVNGTKAENYLETSSMLAKISDNSQYVKCIYVFLPTAEGCYRIFHTTDDTSGVYRAGTKMTLSKEMEALLPDMLDGKMVDPIVSNGFYNWNMTLLTPVYDEYGQCVCYMAVEVTLNSVNSEVHEIVTKILMSLAGFFLLILVTGMWMSGFLIVYPINSIAESVDAFVGAGLNQESLDTHVRKLRQLDIRTEDEIEKMYHSICQMASATAEQMRDIRYYAETTTKMQSGLIITMADLVENRDSDTGAHIQKTAAYVRIVMEGLKKKGYYLEKLTPKFMEDVEMSAPLHDVGKINIPDAVLNKPGKLTPEEYEIMKTHTTMGKNIMEKAISTVRGEGYLKEARNMAAYHHERWDGKGYPEGLHGEIIPLSARIMSVADVFDALTSARVYKPAFPLDEALKIIQEGAGTQFDPKCVEAFMECLPEVKQVLRKYHQL